MANFNRRVLSLGAGDEIIFILACVFSSVDRPTSTFSPFCCTPHTSLPKPRIVWPRRGVDRWPTTPAGSVRPQLFVFHSSGGCKVSSPYSLAGAHFDLDPRLPFWPEPEKGYDARSTTYNKRPPSAAEQSLLPLDLVDRRRSLLRGRRRSSGETSYILLVFRMVWMYKCSSRHAMVNGERGVIMSPGEVLSWIASLSNAASCFFVNDL